MSTQHEKLKAINGDAAELGHDLECAQGVLDLVSENLGPSAESKAVFAVLVFIDKALKTTSRIQMASSTEVAE